MEVKKGKKFLRKRTIAKIIEFMREATWTTPLGRYLIKEKELIPVVDKLEDMELMMEEILKISFRKDKIIVPMGKLLDGQSDDREFYYFLIINEQKFGPKYLVVISETLSAKLSDQNVVEEDRSRNNLIYWFKDLQNNPEAVERDIKKIDKALSEGG